MNELKQMPMIPTLARANKYGWNAFSLAKAQIALCENLPWIKFLSSENE